MSHEHLNKVYKNHCPQPNQLERIEILRTAARHFAILIETHCPVSREASIALTHVQEASLIAADAIVVNE